MRASSFCLNEMVVDVYLISNCRVDVCDGHHKEVNTTVGRQSVDGKKRKNLPARPGKALLFYSSNKTSTNYGTGGHIVT
jgi:hypothetical protein